MYIDPTFKIITRALFSEQEYWHTYLNVDQSAESCEMIIQMCNGVQARGNIFDMNLGRSTKSGCCIHATSTSSSTSQTLVIKPLARRMITWI